MNVPLLDKVKERLTAFPHRFSMANWVRNAPGHDTLDQYPRFGPKDAKILLDSQTACGTVACIGGLAIIIDTAEGEQEHVFNEDVETAGIWKHARKILDLTSEQADRLFLLHAWPEPYCRQYTEHWPNRAQIAVSRINHFIRTGGAE